MSPWPCRLAFSFVLSLSALANAQSIDSERFRPVADPHGFLTIQGTTPLGHKKWRLGFWTHYAKSPVRLHLPAQTTAIRHRLAADAQFVMGLGGRFNLGLDIPFVPYQSSDLVGVHEGAAMGDPRITGRMRILGAATKDENQRNDGPGLALLLAVPIPIGTDDAFTSERQFVFDLQALADFHLLGAGGGVMLGWRFRGDDRQLGVAELQQEFLYGLGIKLPIPVAAKLLGILELRGSTGFNGRTTNTLDGDVGLGYTFGEFTLTTAIGTGFIRGFGAPVLRAILGLSWSPKSVDVDSDGIPDDRDECPRLPEDIDGFQDEDGCMDPDNDNDFIPDEDDKCPNDEALEGRDADEDGCTDPA